MVDQDGVQLVTDTVSYELLKGSTVDYTTDLIRSAFEVGLRLQCHSSALRSFAALQCSGGSQGFSIQSMDLCWPALLRGSVADGCLCLLNQSTTVACKPQMNASADILCLGLPHQGFIMPLVSEALHRSSKVPVCPAGHSEPQCQRQLRLWCLI